MRLFRQSPSLLPLTNLLPRHVFTVQEFIQPLDPNHEERGRYGGQGGNDSENAVRFRTENASTALTGRSAILNNLIH